MFPFTLFKINSAVCIVQMLSDKPVNQNTNTCVVVTCLHGFISTLIQTTKSFLNFFLTFSVFAYKSSSFKKSYLKVKIPHMQVSYREISIIHINAIFNFFSLKSMLSILLKMCCKWTFHWKSHFEQLINCVPGGYITRSLPSP